MTQQMFKFLLTILASLFLLQVNAQTTTYQTYDTAIIEAPISTYENEDEVFEKIEVSETKKKYKNFAADVQGDTAIIFNGFELNKDSINAWKNAKKYEWVKTLEADLKSNLEENSPSRKNRSSKNRNSGEKGIGDNEENTIRERSASGGDNLFNSAGLKIILWILAGAFICFIIYNLFLSKGVFNKNIKQSKAEVVEEEVNENDMDNDFASLQKKAYYAGDTRLAMRYLFLKMLQKLDQKNHIKFAADKTNAVYAREMSDNFRNDFASLAMYFEYIWYGKFDITKEVFDKIETQYNQFLNRI